MRRLFLVFGSVVVATACGGGGGTTPTPPVAGLRGWSGAVTYSGVVSTQGASRTMKWNGNLDWLKITDTSLIPLDAPLPPGAVSYTIKSGSLKLTGSIVAGGCSGSREIMHQVKAGESYLEVQADGSYIGNLEPTGLFDVPVSCPGGGGSVPVPFDPSELGSLRISGKLNNERMKGTMLPPPGAPGTFTGDWDLLALYGAS